MINVILKVSFKKKSLESFFLFAKHDRSIIQIKCRLREGEIDSDKEGAKKIRRKWLNENLLWF